MRSEGATRCELAQLLHDLPPFADALDAGTVGVAHVRLLEPLTGESLAAAFESTTPEPTTGDTRTITQRRHNALHDLVTDVLGRDDRSDVGGERPHVTLFIYAATGGQKRPQPLPCRRSCATPSCATAGPQRSG